MSAISDPSPLVKPWWQSKTIIGIAVMILSQLLRHFRVDVIDSELTDIITLVLDTTGAALAIYGRVNARKALRLTKPGGPFNPRADVRRAAAINRLRGRDGYAGLRAVSVLAVTFCLIGAALAIGPVVFREVPERIGNRPVCELIQVVPVVDKRPFWQRLWSSVTVTPSVAVIYQDGAVSARISKIELRGGADF